MRYWFLLIGVIPCAVALTVASPAPAASCGGPLLFAVAPPPEGGHGGGEGGDDHGKTIGIENGLFKGAIEVSLWTVLVFLLLVFVLKATAWSQIREGLAKRERNIAQAKLDAEHARQEASEARSRLEQEMAKVNDQIRQMMDKARADAQATAAEEMARGKAELNAERERLQRELRLSTDQALQNIWNQAAQLATLISAKAINKQLSEADHRALLDEALKEFRASAETRRQNLEGARG